VVSLHAEGEMAEIICFQIPPDHQLETPQGWSQAGTETFSAARAHVLIIKRRGTKVLKGPILQSIEVPAGSDYVVRRKIIVTTKYTTELQQSLQQTITDTVTAELSNKIGAEIGVSNMLPTGKTSSETLFKTTDALTKTMQRTLVGKQAFELQISHEDERSITVKTKNLCLYVGIWPWRWDVYLYRIERGKYSATGRRRSSVLKQSATTIEMAVLKQSATTIEIALRQPLFSLQFYEPQEDLSISDGEYVPDVENPAQISVEPLETQLPPEFEFPIAPTLEDLWRGTFQILRGS
jgi:hypothetical protein